MNIGEPEEEWEGYNFSGFVPMILAGYRMSAVWRALRGLERLTETIAADIQSEAADYLTWCEAHEHDEYPNEFGLSIDLAAAEVYADEMLAAASELPHLFFGGLVVYLLSMLEATLAGCLEAAQIVTQRPVVKRVPNPKLENYVRALEGCGVHVGWDDEVWAALRQWRDLRNKIVHTFDMPQGAPILSSSAAQEVFWLVDLAIRDVDHAMSALGSFAKRPSP
ncbi:hypothetical protein [Micromonospora sp. NPDC003776]